MGSRSLDVFGGAEFSLAHASQGVVKSRTRVGVTRRMGNAGPERVDARGFECPMPLLMAKRALNGVSVGERILVIATDEGAPRDFEVFARQSGHRLVAVDRHDSEIHLLVEKA